MPLFTFLLRSWKPAENSLGVRAVRCNKPSVQRHISEVRTPSIKTNPATTIALLSRASAPPAACWASWQDAFPALLQRFPDDAARLRASLSAPHAGMPPGLAAACTAAARVRGRGFPVPDWDVAAAPSAPHPPRGDSHLRGWQRAAAAACDERALETHLSHLNPAP